MSSSSGLRGVIAGDTRICTVDGTAGKLIYAGIPIQELADHASFEEVIYLLWHGELPTRVQLDQLVSDLRANAAVPADVLAVMQRFPPDSRPMDALRTAVSLLGMWDPDGSDNSMDASRRRALRLTAQMPTLVTAINHFRHGREPIAPRDDLGLAGNFLYMLTGAEPSPTQTRTFDVALILHADHEFNASTFSARVTIATLSDMYSAITAAVGTLSGPLHGGANEGVFKMLQGIGGLANVRPYIAARLEAKERIMGIGHAVYKTTDPRAANLKQMARKLVAESGEGELFEMSELIEEIMLAEKGLYANVDFYSATVYHVLGIPVDLFTPVFAVSRISGWTAHVLEQLSDNRIIRPRGEYVGPTDRHYVPITER